MLIALIPVASQPADCGRVPEAFLKEPRAEFTGLYSNESWGYSVVIPHDLKGYDAPDPYPHHGIALLLGNPPKAYIVIQAEANSLEHRRPRDAANRSIRSLHDQKIKINSAKIVDARLDGLQAAEITVRYTCVGSPTTLVERTIFALGPSKEPVYEVTLHTSAERFDRDRVTFDRVLASWKYLGY